MAEKSYTVFKVMKITSLDSNGRYSARSAGEHNLRKYIPDNCDPDKQLMNKEIIPLPKDVNGNPMSYRNAIVTSINQAIDNGTMRKVRNNAVYAFEVVLGFSPKDGDAWSDVIPKDKLDEWCNKNKEWLEKTFGKNNVKHLVLHMDEYTPHLHALVVPINEKGRLSFKSFINGPTELSKMQTKYANEVGKDFGLSRGIEKKKAKQNLSKCTLNKIYPDYKTISEFKKNTIGKVVIDENKLKAKENEKTSDGLLLPEYEERVLHDFQDFQFQTLSYFNTVKQSLKENLANANKQIDRQSDEMFKQQVLFEEEKKRQEKKYKEKEEELYKQEQSLKDTISSLAAYKKPVKELKKDFAFFDTLNRGIKNLSDREYAHKLSAEINKIVENQHRIDKQNKKEVYEIAEKENIR